MCMLLRQKPNPLLRTPYHGELTTGYSCTHLGVVGGQRANLQGADAQGVQGGRGAWGREGMKMQEQTVAAHGFSKGRLC